MRAFKKTIILTLLIVLLTSCTTLRISEYENDFLPVPDPIKEDGTKSVWYNEKSDTVEMTFAYWKKIVTFIIFSYKPDDSKTVDKK